MYYKDEKESDCERKASLAALHEAQADFQGVAEEIGLKTEDDVQKLVDEIRHKNKSADKMSKERDDGKGGM